MLPGEGEKPKYTVGKGEPGKEPLLAEFNYSEKANEFGTEGAIFATV